jgi:hypothetical protein
VGGFNGNGYADVLWFNASTGELSYWLLDGQGHLIANPILSSTCDQSDSCVIAESLRQGDQNELDNRRNSQENLPRRQAQSTGCALHLWLRGRRYLN